MFKSPFILSFAVAVLLALTSANAAADAECDLKCQGGSRHESFLKDSVILASLS
ncbi:hypothetical protein GQ600_26139 [Phytophthora cactorum]|nr:hypothetical protein GQ600_26139 [Phytophthora cactorum]